MEEITKFDANFDLKNAVSYLTIESLDVLEDYMDFSIYSTIRKQMPEISNEQEKYWAKILLTNYLNGDINSFTSSYGIRENIYNCDKSKIILMLLKQAIERDSYRQKVLHQLNTKNETEFICQNLTEKLVYSKLSDVFDLAENNSEYRKNLIENYVEFKYRSSIKKEISRIGNSIPASLIALTNLEQTMKLTSMKQSEERKRK